MVIRVLPDLLQRADRPPCNEGLPGYRVIRSVVTGPAGEPVAAFDRDTWTGVQVKVIPYPYRATRGRFDGFVEGGGVARAVVTDGQYMLEIIEHRGFGDASRRIGWGGSGGFTSSRHEVIPIDVAGGDVGGIEMRLPAAPADLPTLPFW